MYNSNLLVNSPAMASGAHRCTKCHMTFNSPHLLAKHQTKFCVGGTGDPDDLLLRRGLWSADSPRRDSPDFDRDSYRRYDPNQDQQLRYLAENHGRQMEYLQLRNKDLEKQREDIRKQLEGLGKRPPPSDRDSTAELLRELKEQEERNQRALEDLRRQLYGLNNQRVNVIEVEKQVQPMVVQAPAPPPPPPPPPPAPAPEPPKKNFIFPVPYHGSSLVAEICAIRQAYIQNGGNDPEVLYQMSKMQADAQAIEDQMKNRQPEKPKEKPKDHTGQFNYLEMENERLHRELMLLQEQNALSQNRRKSDKEDELERALRRLHQDHLVKIFGLQRDMDDLKLLLALERNKPQPQPQAPTIIQGPQPPVSLKPYVEVEPMAPYDQYANRFDKRVPTATRTWVSTQHSKIDDRPMFPVWNEEEKTEFQKQLEALE